MLKMNYLHPMWRLLLSNIQKRGCVTCGVVKSTYSHQRTSTLSQFQDKLGSLTHTKKGSCFHICDSSYRKIKLRVMKDHLTMRSQRKIINNRLTLSAKRTCPYNHIETTSHMDKNLEVRKSQEKLRICFILF